MFRLPPESGHLSASGQGSDPGSDPASDPGSDPPSSGICVRREPGRTRFSPSRPMKAITFCTLVVLTPICAPAFAHAQSFELGATIAAACIGSDGSMCDDAEGTRPLLMGQARWWASERFDLGLSIGRLGRRSKQILVFPDGVALDVTDRRDSSFLPLPPTTSCHARACGRWWASGQAPTVTHSPSPAIRPPAIRLCFPSNSVTAAVGAPTSYSWRALLAGQASDGCGAPAGSHTLSATTRTVRTSSSLAPATGSSAHHTPASPEDTACDSWLSRGW